MNDNITTVTNSQNFIHTNQINSPIKQRRTFTTVECLFAWVCYFWGYLLCRACPVWVNPLGGFLIIFSLYIITVVVLKIKGGKLLGLPIVSAVSAVLISFALILSSNCFLHFFAYCYSLSTYFYFIYSATGNCIKRGFNDFIAMDFIKATFVMPFCSFGQMFRAMFSGKAKNSGKFIAKLLIGISVAIIPTIAVFFLLSYDSEFINLINKIFDFDFYDVFSQIISFGLAIPIGMYLFGLFISSSDNKCKRIMTAESCKSVSKKVKFAPAVTVFTAVFPLLFLYVVFFVSQWKYYISGFTSVLPEGFSYARYAREGFFQLCIVSLINLVAVVAAIMFMRRKNEQPPLILKLLSITLSIFTLVLISTAFAKLVMYIDYYGLTKKRVYAAWLMGVIAVIFILIILKQLIFKFNVLALSIAICVVMFGILSLSNIDRFIAKYNVDRYLNSTLSTVDVDTLAELGDSAVPDMVRLLSAIEESKMNNTVSAEAEEIYIALEDTLYDIRNFRFSKESNIGVFSYNLPYIEAQKALLTLEDNKDYTEMTESEKSELL